MTTKHGAEELADGLLKAMSALIAHISTYKDGYKFQLEKVNIFTQSATMLRQQQTEIAELKHMNKNWQISEGMALQEIELAKEFLKANELYFSYVVWRHTK